ncbi:MAG: hypothetical protein ACKVJG_10120 [Candidatus Latescibacterota bacterium]
MVSIIGTVVPIMQSRVTSVAKMLFLHIFRACGAHGDDDIAQIGGAVVDADLYVGGEFGAKFG